MHAQSFRCRDESPPPTAPSAWRAQGKVILETFELDRIANMICPCLRLDFSPLLSFTTVMKRTHLIRRKIIRVAFIWVLHKRRTA